MLVVVVVVVVVLRHSGKIPTEVKEDGVWCGGGGGGGGGGGASAVPTYRSSMRSWYKSDL